MTLKELAKATGYSIATISRVLNDDMSLRVSDDTKMKIKTIAEASGYRPARQKEQKKREERSGTARSAIGIIEMLDIQMQLKDPYYMYLKGFVEQACFDQKAVTAKLQYDDAKQTYVNLNTQKLDGIIAIGRFTEKEISSMETISSNLVFLDSSPCDGVHSSVLPDLSLGVRQGIDYLTEMGHRRICFAGPAFSPNSCGQPEPETRRSTFAQYMKKKGLSGEMSFLECERSTESAVEAVNTILDSSSPLPSVYFAVNESVALGLLKALEEHGHKVPEDISILSYNNTVFSAFITPPLSSISLNIEHMAKISVDLVLSQARTDASYPVKILAASSVAKRDSVACLTEIQ